MTKKKFLLTTDFMTEGLADSYKKMENEEL
jgi:hypothetical protein